MIAYSDGCCNGLFTRRTMSIMRSLGFVRSALKLAFLFSCGGTCLKAIDEYIMNGSIREYVPNDGLYKSFCAFCGFLIVFRSSHAISRYTEGVEFALAFTGTWFNAASSLFSFCRGSKASSIDVQSFQQTYVRLVSLLVALSFAELSGEPDHRALFELIDIHGIDKESIQLIHCSDCRVECVYQMVQSLVTANVSNGVLCMPPPILSRAFQEMGNAMIKFHEAVKYSYCPIPYPYVVVTECFLLLHGCYSAVQMMAWTNALSHSFFWTFVIVFALRFLNGLSMELENPFGTDANDVDTVDLHFDMNKRFITLLRVHETPSPTLSSTATLDCRILNSQLSCEGKKTTVTPVMTCLEEVAKAPSCGNGNLSFRQKQESEDDGKPEFETEPSCRTLEQASQIPGQRVPSAKASGHEPRRVFQSEAIYQSASKDIEHGSNLRTLSKFQSPSFPSSVKERDPGVREVERGSSRQCDCPAGGVSSQSSRTECRASPHPVVGDVIYRI